MDVYIRNFQYRLQMLVNPYKNFRIAKHRIRSILERLEVKIEIKTANSLQA